MYKNNGSFDKAINIIKYFMLNTKLNLKDRSYEQPVVNRKYKNRSMQQESNKNKKIAMTQKIGDAFTSAFFNSLNLHSSEQSLENLKGQTLYSPRRKANEMAKSHLFQLLKKNNDLKQTSSTTSNEYPINDLKRSRNDIPSFVKLKSKKNSQLSSSPIQKQYNPKQNFRIIKKLGQGKFGTVYLVRQKKTGMILAMKVIQKSTIKQKGLLMQFIRQLKIHSMLAHPNIISLYGFFNDDNYFFVLMELGCDGQLYNLMLQKKIKSQSSVSFITNNLLDAINYMHHQHILHRDIKPENIVLIHGTVKLCDFGWAVNNSSKQQLRETFCGTPLYLSPQILTGNKYDQTVDLWAIGVLTYELLFNKSPFKIQSQKDLINIINYLNPQYNLKRLQIPFSKKNPKERIDGSILKQAKFIRKYQQMETCQELCY